MKTCHSTRTASRIVRTAVALGALLGVASVAVADLIPYPTAGIQNPVTYTFTASATGTITAYFYGSTAAYDNDLSLLVNGVPTGVEGLDNQTSTYGQVLNLGSVTAGDTLVFKLNNIVPGDVGPWYSDQSMNSDGVNHVYSTPFSGDSIIPAGTFVGFEDLAGGGDLNYNDETFVFTNVSSGVPEPATLALVALGLAGLGLIRRRRALR